MTQAVNPTTTALTQRDRVKLTRDDTPDSDLWGWWTLKVLGDGLWCVEGPDHAVYRLDDDALPDMVADALWLPAVEAK